MRAHLRLLVRSSIKRKHFSQRTIFFPIGKLFECLSQGADVGLKEDGTFRYPSYVQDIMG